MPVHIDPLRDLYKSLSGRGALPLNPDDPYYVPILQATPEKDPISCSGSAWPGQNRRA